MSNTLYRFFLFLGRVVYINESKRNKIKKKVQNYFCFPKIFLLLQCVI